MNGGRGWRKSSTATSPLSSPASSCGDGLLRQQFGSCSPWLQGCVRRETSDQSPAATPFSFGVQEQQNHGCEETRACGGREHQDDQGKERFVEIQNRSRLHQRGFHGLLPVGQSLVPVQDQRLGLWRRISGGDRDATRVSSQGDDYLAVPAGGARKFSMTQIAGLLRTEPIESNARRDPSGCATRAWK